MERDAYQKNKRIASNTILLFLRMLVITIINLYSVRLVLRGLGTEDYGIFNAVAGVVTTSSFLSSVLAESIQRFFSFALGKKDNKALGNIFSESINILIVLSIIILIFFETIGLWFVHTQLNIPDSRMASMEWIYQCALFAFLFSLLEIPFTAAIFSHEDMGLYALISTIDCLGRLTVAILLGVTLFDHLSFYGSGLLIVSFCIFLMYVVIGYRRYPECHYHRPNDKHLYKKLLNFSGWTLFGSLANTGMMQGSTILINIFFGPILNAAFGIAQQINNAFNALCNSMVLPFRPAMIKAYAEGNNHYLNQLFSVSNKFLIYILTAIALPLLFEMDSILKLWLGKTSDSILLFSRLMVIFTVFLAMHNPITIIMHANGHIREYHLPVESIILCCLPITWGLYLLGCPAYSVFIAMIGLCLMAHIVRLFCLRHFYDQFSIGQYLYRIILPATCIALMGIVLTDILHNYITVAAYRLIVIFLTEPCFVLVLAFFLGLNPQEKTICKQIFAKTLKRLKP